MNININMCLEVGQDPEGKQLRLSVSYVTEKLILMATMSTRGYMQIYCSMNIQGTASS